MTERNADTMHTEIAQATAEQAYGAAHRALRRAARALWLAALALILSCGTLAVLVAKITP